MKFTRHEEIIFREMFSRVGEDFDNFVFTDFWWTKKEWTLQESNSFCYWLTDYMFNNKDARKELMRFPSRDKEECKRFARYFICIKGWKWKRSENTGLSKEQTEE